jgi:membrane fusion protein (multidrug efflux system)
MQNHIRSLTLLMALLSVLSVCGCAEKKEIVPTASSDVQELPVTKVIKQTLSRVDQLPGEIQAYQDVAIYPKVPGFIDWIGVDRGSTVKKGQVMVV